MSIFRKLILLISAILFIELLFGGLMIGMQIHSRQDVAQVREKLNATSLLTRYLFYVIQLRQEMFKKDVNSPVVTQLAVDLKKIQLTGTAQRIFSADELKVFREGHALLNLCLEAIVDARKRLLDPRYRAEYLRADLWQPLDVKVKDGLRFGTMTTEFVEKQNAQTRELISKRQQLDKTSFAVLCFGGLFELFALAALYMVFRKSIARRMDTILENLRRGSRQESLLPADSGSDEISQLDGSIHYLVNSLREAAKREREVLANQRDLICRLDEGLRILSCNNSGAMRFGYSPSDLEEQQVETIIKPEQVVSVKQRLQESREGQTVPIPVTVIRGDGGEADTTWYVSWRPLRSSFFCVVHDITAHAQLQRFQQQILRMVSHDLRNPLMTLSGFFEIAQAGMLGKLSPQGVELIKSGETALSQTLRLIGDLLDLEKIDANMLQLEKREVALQAVLDSALEITERLAIANNITVNVQACDQLIDVDQHRITQVVANLLSHAIGRSALGGTVEVVGLSALGLASIRIIDRGSDLERENLDHLFDRFSEGEYSREEKQGMRLRLSISMALVKLHGGSITASKGNDGGLIVEITIPISG